MSEEEKPREGVWTAENLESAYKSIEKFFSEPEVEVRLTKKQFRDIIDVLTRTARHGPPQGEKEEGIACGFCDMGGAGYATRGDGFHDDDCATKDAQLLLERLAHKEALLGGRQKEKV